MYDSKLWISFHFQDDYIDHWALYLDAEHMGDCDVWQASGQTFEFEPIHIRGMRPETVPNFKEKWLIKDCLTNAELQTIRDIAGSHPVDNEAAYWDCRTFCFEILASLEIQNVLRRSDEDYRQFRKRLHEKWRYDDGVDTDDSEDEMEEEFIDDETPDMTRVNDSDLEDESSDDDDN